MSGNEVQWVRFDQLAATYANGGTPPSSRPECWGGRIGFISTAWIAEDQTEVFSSPRTITEQGVESCSTRVIEPNALLVGTRVGVGKAAVNRVPLAISQDITAVRLKPNIDPIFAAFAFKIESAQAHFRGRKRGATIQGVSRGDLQELLIPLPSKESQRGIVRTLEAIQAARLARLGEIELERERKAAIMAHLFAYGTQNEPRRDTTLGPLPETWDVVPMGKVCKFLSGGTPSKSRPDFWQGTIPWVSGKDLKHPRLDDVVDHVSEEGASVGSKIAPAHSILILVRGMGLAKDIPMSQIARPMAFNQDLKAICPPDEAAGDFLYWALQQVKPDFERHIGMAAHGTRKIAGSVLDNLLIPLPQVEERKAIADALWAAHACGIALEAEAKLLDELFRATLEELMSGRLSVTSLLQELVA